MPKQAAKLPIHSPFPLGEGLGMGPDVLIGGIFVCPLNSYIFYEILKVPDDLLCNLCKSNDGFDDLSNHLPTKGS